MKVKMTMAFLALFLFAGTAGLAAAQDEEYRLTTAKGSTWEIKADSLNLGEHVGHTVSVTGVVSHAKMYGMKEDAKDEAEEHGGGKDATEHGHMTVTNLRMVSESWHQEDWLVTNGIMVSEG